MRKLALVVLVLTCFLFAACGQHQQSLVRVNSKGSIAQAGETDSKLILINAINSGDLDKVKSALEEVKDVNTYDSEGLTLVMIALKAQQFAVVEYLVLMDADLELKTNSKEIQPSLSAREYLANMMMDEQTKSVMQALLNKENFEIVQLNDFIYSSINFKNASLLDWLLAKGVSPNTIRKSPNGKDKDTPLIFLFSLIGVKDQEFVKLNGVFNLLVDHPDIDVNLKVKGDTALGKALRRLKSDSAYKGMVDRLKSMGAKE